MSQEVRRKQGGVRLLQEMDYLLTNVLGKPLIGWLPIPHSRGGLVNRAGWAMLRAVGYKYRGNGSDPSDTDLLYDQPLLIENAGAIVVCLLGDRVGLVENFQMVGERLLLNAGSSYIRYLSDDALWAKLLSGLGEWRWELPRGLANIPTPDNFNDYILKCAKAEAAEEAGINVTDVRIAGRVNANSTFFVHSQYVVQATVESRGQSRPEALEMIGKTRFFTREEIRKMVNAHELDDGLTLAALAICGWHF